jgi:hypothetical protein
MRPGLLVTLPRPTAASQCEIEAAAEAKGGSDERQVAEPSPTGSAARLLDQRVEFVFAGRLRWGL